MEKNLNFYKKIFLAITDFKFYPYILKTESLNKSFKYFIKLMLLAALFITVYVSKMIFSVMDNFDFDNPYEEQNIMIFGEEILFSFPEEVSVEELRLTADSYKDGKLNKFTIFVFTYSIVFAVFGMTKLVGVLFVAFFVSAICALFRIGIDVKNHIKIAIYTRTLPIILEVLSILIVGRNKRLYNDCVNITYNSICILCSKSSKI